MERGVERQRRRRGASAGTQSLQCAALGLIASFDIVGGRAAEAAGVADQRLAERIERRYGGEQRGRQQRIEQQRKRGRPSRPDPDRPCPRHSASRECLLVSTSMSNRRYLDTRTALVGPPWLLRHSADRGVRGRREGVFRRRARGRHSSGNIKLFGLPAVRRIDFERIRPMFRANAARYRSAISEFGRLFCVTQIPVQICVPFRGWTRQCIFTNPSGGFDQRDGPEKRSEDRIIPR